MQSLEATPVKCEDKVLMQGGSLHPYRAWAQIIGRDCGRESAWCLPVGWHWSGLGSCIPEQAPWLSCVWAVWPETLCPCRRLADSWCASFLVKLCGHVELLSSTKRGEHNSPHITSNRCCWLWSVFFLRIALNCLQLTRNVAFPSLVRPCKMFGALN